MPMFKIWDCTRSLRKCVIATSLEELKKKGCQKLNIMSNVTIVTSSDGTEVDEDEILSEMAGEILIFLKDNEAWVQYVDDGPPDNVDGEKLKPEVQPDCPVQTDSTSEPACPVQPVVREKTALFGVNIISEIRRGNLPPYSELVLRHLRNDEIELVWNKMIGETADYYFGKYGDQLNDSSQYRAIGEKIYGHYPCIRMEGTHPWTLFVRTVSMKIRHIRRSQKSKSQSRNGLQKNTCQDPKAPPPKKFRSTAADQPQASAEDVKSHVTELREEWKKMKKNRNVAHIKMLLTKTIHYRDELLKKNDRLLSSIIDEFPCFTDGSFVLFDFSTRFGSEKYQEVVTRMQRFQSACQKLIGRKEDTTEEKPLEMLDIIQYVEQETKFDRSGKNGNIHFKPLVNVLDDVDDSEIDHRLSTKEMESPYIIMFTKESTIKGMFIVGDGVKIRVQGSSVMSGVLQLLLLYYIFDIDYAKCHAMVLGLLQQVVVAEPYTFQTSKKFKFFLKKFRPVFEELDNSQHS